MHPWKANTKKRTALWAVLVLLWTVAFFREDAQAQDERSGEVLYLQYCAVCHGFNAEGRLDFKAPPLAQMPHWYVIKQLGHFKFGRRGSHPLDTDGAIMAAYMSVVEEKYFAPIAQWIASQKRIIPEAVENVKTEMGKVLFEERCMECHRYNATGDYFFQSPPLAGLPSWYLTKQIDKFRQGIRGFSKQDIHGQKMMFNVGFIHTPEEQASLIGYIIELQRKNASLEDLKFGQD